MKKLSETIQQVVIDTFGLKFLGAGWHGPSESQNLNYSFSVESIWIAQIYKLYDIEQDGSTLDSVTLIGVQAIPEEDSNVKPWTKALMLVPPFYEPKTRAFAGASPIKLLDIEYDFVANALNCVPLLETRALIELDGDGWPDFTLHAFTRASQASFHFSSIIVHPHLLALWSAIREMAKEITLNYDDEEISEFFKRYVFPQRYDRTTYQGNDDIS